MSSEEEKKSPSPLLSTMQPYEVLLLVAWVRGFIPCTLPLLISDSLIWRGEREGDERSGEPRALESVLQALSCTWWAWTTNISPGKSQNHLRRSPTCISDLVFINFYGKCATLKKICYLLIYKASEFVLKLTKKKVKPNPDGHCLNACIREIGSNTIAGPKAIACCREYKSICI